MNDDRTFSQLTGCELGSDSKPESFPIELNQIEWTSFVEIARPFEPIWMSIAKRLLPTVLIQILRFLSLTLSRAHRARCVFLSLHLSKLWNSQLKIETVTDYLSVDGDIVKRDWVDTRSQAPNSPKQ